MTNHSTASRIFIFFCLLVFSLFIINSTSTKYVLTATSKVNTYYIKLDSVQQLACTDGITTHSGTAFLIKPNVWVTAAHVLNEKTRCMILGQEAIAISADTARDVTVFVAPSLFLTPFKVKCEPYIKAQEYYGLGFAFSKEYVMTKLLGTGRKEFYVIDKDKRIFLMSKLYGSVYQGMSGGPILNSSGEVVGVINMTDDNHTIAISQSLVDTVVCKK